MNHPFKLFTIVTFLTFTTTGCNALFADPTADSNKALTTLENYLQRSPEARELAGSTTFKSTPLTKEDAAKAQTLLYDDLAKQFLTQTQDELKANTITIAQHKMKLLVRKFGAKPEAGHSLFISMHGGGSAPKQVNDQQWQNQIRLYQPKEGYYIAPRAPTDAWNMWHQAHMDALLDRLIAALVVRGEVNPNRVYAMGYSAGGDGMYQIAPRMADRWAAAAMMAGHPGDASPLNLRNIGFTIHMGGRDAAYNRNKLAAEWQKKLEALQQKEPNAYPHEVHIYPDLGHWMQLRDKSSIPYMSKFTRNPFPQKIIWRQDDVTGTRFYWLAVDQENAKPKTTITAQLKDQTITITDDLNLPLTLRLNDTMLNMDQPITVIRNGKQVFQGQVPRTIQTIEQTINERYDPTSIFTGQITIPPNPAPAPDQTTE